VLDLARIINFSYKYRQIFHAVRKIKTYKTNGQPRQRPDVQPRRGQTCKRGREEKEEREREKRKRTVFYNNKA
jgi:hypothetical protein